MNTFALLERLPPTLEIRLNRTNEAWTNASPRLTMVGSKIWLSYGIGAMDCVLYERAEDEEELVGAVIGWAKKLHGRTFLAVDSVFIDGMLRMPYRDGNAPVPPPFFL